MNHTSAMDRDNAREAVLRIFCSLQCGLSTLAEGIAEANQLYSDYKGLSAMSNHELAAMGIRRADIPAIVTGSFGRAAAKAPHTAYRTAEQAAFAGLSNQNKRPQE